MGSRGSCEQVAAAVQPGPHSASDPLVMKVHVNVAKLTEMSHFIPSSVKLKD